MKNKQAMAIIKDKLIQKIKWGLPNSPQMEMFMYGEASVEANKEMQGPLEKLYQYENQPDIREKVREYINQLDEEIKRAESEIVNTDDKDYEARMMSRLNTLTEVRNDLLGRLEEVV